MKCPKCKVKLEQQQTVVDRYDPSVFNGHRQLWRWVWVCPKCNKVVADI